MYTSQKERSLSFLSSFSFCYLFFSQLLLCSAAFPQCAHHTHTNELTNQPKENQTTKKRKERALSIKSSCSFSNNQQHQHIITYTHNVQYQKHHHSNITSSSLSPQNRICTSCSSRFSLFLHFSPPYQHPSSSLQSSVVKETTILQLTIPFYQPLRHHHHSLKKTRLDSQHASLAHSSLAILSSHPLYTRTKHYHTSIITSPSSSRRTTERIFISCLFYNIQYKRSVYLED